MMTPEITAHMIVRNEDRCIWYAIMSVLPFVKTFLLYDTGSEDNTVQIINSIDSEKIRFQQIRIDQATDIGQLRQKQIDETSTDWFWVIDGDEVYSNAVCNDIIHTIKTDGTTLEGIVVGRYDLMGDIFHYQSEMVGTYNLFGRKGHYVIRLLNKKNIPGLHIQGLYPYEGYYDDTGREVINRDSEKYRFIEKRMFHAMYLRRSSKGANLTSTFHRKKWKIEQGIPFPADFHFPEVLQQPRPELVPDIRKHRSLVYEAAAAVITPIKVIKRRLVHNKI